MVAFLPFAVRVMIWLRPSNNQFGALLSSPFPEEPRIVPADAIVAAQSTANATRANLLAVRFDVMFSPTRKLIYGEAVSYQLDQKPCVLTDACSADCDRTGLDESRRILCLLPSGRNPAGLPPAATVIGKTLYS